MEVIVQIQLIKTFIVLVNIIIIIIIIIGGTGKEAKPVKT